LNSKKTDFPSVAGLYSKCPVICWIALFLFAGFIAAIRLHTYDEPYECDGIAFAAFGDELLKGHRLYSDLGDNKPPLIYLTFAAAEFLTGYGRPSFYFLGVMGALVGMMGLFAIGRKLSGKVSVGLLASFLWVLVSSSCELDANQPKIETFMNDLLIWVFLLYLVQKKDSMDWKNTFGIGALFLLGTLYKPFFIVPAAIWALFNGWTADSSDERRVVVRQTALILGVVAAGWTGLFAYFFLTGRFHVFWVAMVERGLFHSGNIFSHFLTAFSVAGFFPSCVAFLFPLVMISFGGFAAGYRKNPRPWIMWLAFCVSIFIEIAVPGHFYPYYYQLWLPLACVGAAWGGEALWEAAGPSFTLGSILCAVLVLSIDYRVWYRNSPDDISYDKYGDNFIYDEPIGKAIQGLLLPEEKFYEWSALPHFYLCAHREPVTSALFVHELLAPTPLGAELSARVLGDLSKSKPELVVIDLKTENFQFPGVSFDLDSWRKNPVYRYLQENYKFFMGAVNGRFLFLYRKEGALKERLKTIKKLPTIDVFIPNPS
jgi:hypothetical protein